MSNELINLIIGAIFGTYITVKVYRVIDAIYSEVEKRVNQVKGLI